MTKLLLLLDKDGTLIKPASGEFVQHPEDQELLPGVAERIAKYAAAGWTTVIVSNQDGVEAEYKTLDDPIAVMRFCLKLINHHRLSRLGSAEDFRSAYFALPIRDKVLMVGDRPEDQQAAANAGVEFMWADEWRNQALRIDS